MPAKDAVAEFVEHFEPRPDEPEPQPIVAPKNVVEPTGKTRPFNGDLRRTERHDGQPNEKAEAAEQRLHACGEPCEKAVGPPERDADDERVEPSDCALHRALVLLGVSLGALAFHGDEVVVFEPAEHLECFVFGVCLALRIAGETGEDRGDGLRAVERAEEAVFVKAHAVELRRG